MAYRFVQGIDYGRRRSTLGWNIHMAEGGDGTVGWLARRSGETEQAWRNRVNGVSANFVVLTDGEVVQMVGWDRAAGNLNPADRSTDKAFYGRRFLIEVLGDRWTDPNSHTLSVEICGFRKAGPSQAQVDSVVELVAEGTRRFPTIVGAFGHADQTDTKGCPGTAPLMLELWRRIGHGAFKEADMPGLDLRPVLGVPVTTVTVDVPKGAEAIYSTDRRRDQLDVNATARTATGPWDPTNISGEQRGYEVVLAGGRAWIRESALTIRPDVAGDATGDFNAGVDAAVAAAATARR
jgi:hypothetical protein